MTIRQEFICDKKGCPSREESWEACLSKKWVDLQTADKSYQFCSVTCLRDWLMDVRPVDTEEERLGVVFECAGCGTEILLRPGEEWPVWVEIKTDGPAKRFGFCKEDCMDEYMRPQFAWHPSE